MNKSDAPATRGNLQRDVQQRPRLATLTCPNCLGTLQIKADVNAEAPCPICRHPLKYVAPAPAEPQRFVAKQRIPANPAQQQTAPRQAIPQQAAPQTAAPQTAAPRQAAPRQAAPQPAARRQTAPQQKSPPQSQPPRQSAPAEAVPDRSLRSVLNRMDDFLNTPAGTSLAWVLLAGLLTACVILFFHWDQDRRERTLRMEAIEATRPAASHRPTNSPVPLLPGEPAPVDPFKIKE